MKRKRKHMHGFQKVDDYLPRKTVLIFFGDITVHIFIVIVVIRLFIFIQTNITKYLKMMNLTACKVNNK